jgi:DNA-binding NarL/FixJ family response regulator
MNEKIRVVIADDHDLYRGGLAGLLKAERIEVLSEASNAPQLIKQVTEYNPDVIITDLIMPGDGVKAIKELVRKGITRIIALSSFESEGLVSEAIEAGALGFIKKNADNADIIEAIKTVYDFKYYYCKSLTIKMALRLAKINNSRFTKITLPPFSAVEIEIIRMVCDGKLTADIAKNLFFGTRKVERMRSLIMKKMGVKTQAELAIYAVKNSIYILPHED